MITRFKGLSVALEENTREDEAEGIINAIKQIRGVSDVKGIEVEDEDWIIRDRIKHEIWTKLWNVFNDKQL